MNDRLAVLYLRGLDRRSINPQDAPFLHGMLSTFPTLTYQSVPFTDQLPTLLSGLEPRAHRIMGVTIHPERPKGPATQLAALVPDAVTTLAQCVDHAVRGGVDLSSVPWRRRRHFDMHRMGDKVKRSVRAMDTIGEHQGLHGLLGNASAYRFTPYFTDFDAMREAIPQPGIQFDFFDTYAYDLYEHWHLDQPEKLRERLTYLDQFVATLHTKCQDQGVTMAVLSDHGQALVTKEINIHQLLQKLAIPARDYHYFSEVPLTRFWFKTDHARQTILARLKQEPDLQIVHWSDMKDHGVELDDDDFGEYWAYTRQGTVYFPSDFYHFLGNLYLARKNPEMQPRAQHPRHRGYHGHLPIDHPAEQGFMTVLNNQASPTSDMLHAVDFAPTVLSLLNQPIPERMKGQPAFSVAARSLVETS